MRKQVSVDDDGFTLVEVIVAMFLVMIVMTGFLYTITASLAATRDTRARVVAANLASQQIDALRSVADVFTVESDSRSTELNGDTFHVRWDASWVPDTGGTISCEAGVATGSLAYLHVTVEVRWDNLREGAQPVYSDTSLTPRTKINDPTLGTVLVGVIDANGEAVEGVNVQLSAAGVPDATTNGDGCAYLLKVPAGTHTVTVSKVEHVNEQQLDHPTATVPVKAGGTSRVSFTLAAATKFRVEYATNVTGAVSIPTNLTTTFLSTYGNFQMAPTPTPTPNANPKTFGMFPLTSGYSVVAGAYTESPVKSCLAPDPGQWAAQPGMVGKRPVAAAGQPGSVITVQAAMGGVKLSLTGTNNNKYLKAVYVGGGAGDPGCAAGMEYVFGSVIGSGTTVIALPYGTWQLYRGGAGSQSMPITSGITVLSGGSVAASGRVVLDPRVPG